VGFDWTKKQDVWKKVEEELQELQQAEQSGDHRRTEDEFGDLLFALVNYARFIKVDPEFSLRRMSEKFIRRFQYIEKRLGEQGKRPSDLSLEELDTIWEEGKRAGI
jgi:uncharacterized protein YabN with tetrapyrrole methylase and pyrophosphatase domain